MSTTKTAPAIATGIFHYRAYADDTAEAVEQADKWLSMFLRWQDPASGESYDIDAATIIRRPDGEEGESVYDVAVKVTYTQETSTIITGNPCLTPTGSVSA